MAGPQPSIAYTYPANGPIVYRPSPVVSGSSYYFPQGYAGVATARTVVAKKDAPVTLKYANGRGLMEVARLCFAANSKFPPADYTDGRYDSVPEPSAANLGRWPICQVGDEHIGQSGAIYLYAANVNGLMGDSFLQGAQIWSVYEHVREMILASQKVFTQAYGTAPADEALDKWLNGGATDASGQAVRENSSSRYLTWWLGRIENSLTGTNGFAVGNKLSLADICLYYMLDEHLPASQADESIPEFRRHPFGTTSAEVMQKKLANYPKIKASCDNAKKNAGIKKWIESRGKQKF